MTRGGGGRTRGFCGITGGGGGVFGGGGAAGVIAASGGGRGGDTGAGGAGGALDFGASEVITRVGSGVRAAGAVGGAGGRTGGGGGAAGRGGIPAEGVVGTGGLGIGGRARFAPGGGGRTGPDEGDGIGGRAVGDGFTGAAGGVGADDTTRLGSSGRRLPGGFGGKFSRTSARASSVAAPPFDVDGRGGRVIRTVSFLGSFGSLIVEISSAAKFR